MIPGSEHNEDKIDPHESKLHEIHQSGKSKQIKTQRHVFNDKMSTASCPRCSESSCPPCQIRRWPNTAHCPSVATRRASLSQDSQAPHPSPQKNWRYFYIHSEGLVRTWLGCINLGFKIPNHQAPRGFTIRWSGEVRKKAMHDKFRHLQVEWCPMLATVHEEVCIPLQMRKDTDIAKPRHGVFNASVLDTMPCVCPVDGASRNKTFVVISGSFIKIQWKPLMWMS